jgi:hypothetical protein
VEVHIGERGSAASAWTPTFPGDAGQTSALHSARSTHKHIFMSEFPLHRPLAFGALLDALEAAAEVTRLRLLGLLCEAELTVSELVGILGQSQPRISRHLKLLVDAGTG